MLPFMSFQELTAAEEEQVEEDKEKQLQVSSEGRVLTKNLMNVYPSTWRFEPKVD